MKMNEEKHLKEILSDFDDAMLTTIETNGLFRSRPMRIAQLTDVPELWFVTGRPSGKIDEIASNPKVCVTCQGGGKYLSLTGLAKISSDKSKIDELWNESLKVWFPDGKSDPDITLICFTPDQGEYWDLSGTNRVQYLYQAAKAHFSGDRLDTQELDSHAKINL